jgi:phage-related protein
MSTNHPFVNGPGDNPFEQFFMAAYEKQAQAAKDEYDREDSKATADMLAKVREYLVNEEGYSKEIAAQAAFLSAQGHYMAFHWQLGTEMLVTRLARLLAEGR